MNPPQLTIKKSEFYEKYCKITLPNSEQVTPKLTDEERMILNKAEELGVSPYIRLYKRETGYAYEIHPQVKDALKIK